MAPVSGIKFKVAKHDARPVIRVGSTPRNAEGVLKSVWDPSSAMTSDRASTKCKGGLICLLAKSDESLTRSRAFPVILRKRCNSVNLIYTTKKWICVHSPTGLQPTPRTHNQACCLPSYEMWFLTNFDSTSGQTTSGLQFSRKWMHSKDQWLLHSLDSNKHMSAMKCKRQCGGLAQLLRSTWGTEGTGSSL